MKPIVYYNVDMGFPDLQIGRSCRVHIYSHHSDTGRGKRDYYRYVETSPILAIHSNGQFETHNTEYRPDRVINDDEE